ncbi:MCOLN2 [Bugula neritina]|uniref:MCOLN2 n=1 Tax=Bugula neritina TaxID=10212 RepID=A0A7J7KNJ9_BUGNE|nr:MCOLN2 [Bugula neritina]
MSPLINCIMVEEDMRSVNSQSTEHLVYSMTPREDTPYTPYEVDRLKRHLKFHFMTPCQKFKARKRKPWKLIVQILKIIIVTTQVFVFGMQRGNFVDFEQKTQLSLQHLLFKGWEPSYETMPYPAAIGRYALYKTTEIVDHLNYAMTNFNLTEKLAIGAYGFTEDQAGLRSKTATLTLVKFQVGEIFPNNVTYNLNPNLDKVSLTFNATKLENGTEVYDFHQVLRNNGQELSVNKLHSMELNFSLYGIHLKQGTNKVNVEPDCLLIKGKIKYDNSKHNGQMTVFMEIELVSKTCNDGSIFEEDTELETIALILLDSVVVLLCFLSTVTCARSMKRSVILYRKSRVFFKKHYGYKCTWEDVMVFANFWYVMIVTSDILCVIGTGLKVAISHQEYKYMEYSGMLLGIATVLVWMGVIRYFEYFERYNVLVLTCKKAFPDVIRFMICAATIYIAFTICGWLVLGPYHIKFQTIFASSSVCFRL